jgi:hypothetical protein
MVLLESIGIFNQMNRLEKFYRRVRLNSSVLRFTFLIAILGFSFNPATSAGHFKVPTRTELHEQVREKVAASTSNYFSTPSIFQGRLPDDQFFIEHLRIFRSITEHHLKSNAYSFAIAIAKIGFHPRTHS